MAAIEPLCRLIGVNPNYLRKEENILLEAEILIRLCEELKEVFRIHHKNFFRLMKFTLEMENTMLESNFVRLVIKDILSTGEYTLKGFAHYADTHEDVVHEVISGQNTNPSALLLRRAITLHCSVRNDLYNTIIKKITSKYLADTVENQNL